MGNNKATENNRGLSLVIILMIFKDYIREIEDFYRNNGVKIDPAPHLRLDRTEADLFDPFIRTGHYEPQTRTIVLNISNRQVKDILRSFCHELIHHHQNIVENKFDGIDVSGNLNENKNLELLEAEAYQMGNIMFRRWTETHRNN